MLSPACIRSKPLLMSSSFSVWVIIGIDRDLPVHVPVDDLRHVGAALGAAEGSAAPVAAGDELERARRDFLAGLGNSDDDARAPAAVAAFERGAHHLGVARRVERVIGAAVGDLEHFVDDRLAVFVPAVDEVGHAELAAPFLARRVDVDSDDLVSADQLRALDHVEAYAAEAEHDNVRSGLDLGRVDHRTDSGRDSAADVAAGVERRVLADLGHRDLGQDGEVREGRAAHVMEDGLALVAEAAGAVRHHALALGRANGGAEIGLARKARLTLAAFGRVQRDHVVARLDAGHAGADFAHHARTLMTEDRRENALRCRSHRACRRRCGRCPSP